MAAASIARRSTFLRTLLYQKPNAIHTSSRFSSHSSPTTSPFSLHRQSPRNSQSLSSSPLRLRRELSSMIPVHSAIASACLVSKLPVCPNSPAQCRFANYVSPI